MSCGVPQAEAELVAGLRPFIQREIVRALGKEYLADYSPPAHADGPTLLRYLDDKWMSIFDESPLQNNRELIRSAYQTLLASKRDSRSGLPSEEATRYVERVLQAIGAAGRSARAANGSDSSPRAPRWSTSPAGSAQWNGSPANSATWEDRHANEYGGVRNIDTRQNPSPASTTRLDYSSYTFDACNGENHTSPKTDANLSFHGGVTAGDPAYGGGRPRTVKVDADGDMAMGDAMMEPQPPSRTPTTVRSERGNDTAMLDIGEGPSSTGPVAVVLDGANIGWKRGVNRFSMAGAAAALAYFQRRGYPCTLVLPEGRFRAPSHMDDEATCWVRALRGTDALLEAPDSDYDDAYVTGLARRTGAVVVSNDKFADQVYQAEAQGEQAVREWREYLAKCRCSFAFVGDTFVPNPAFDFVRAGAAARKYAITPD